MNKTLKKILSSLILLILLASCWSWTAIPFGRYLGVDFQNIYAFENCGPQASPSFPYDIGAGCGDVYGRPYVYPPFHFHSFFWMKYFSFHQALWIWLFCLVGILVGALCIWGRKSKPVTLMIGALFLCQFPTYFAFERGSIDAAVVALWTLTYLFFSWNWLFVSGLIAALSVSFKLYPAFALLPIGLGFTFLAATRKMPISKWLKFSAGVFAGLAIPAVLYWSQYRYYFGTILPQFKNTPIDFGSYSHVGFSSHPWKEHLYSVLILGGWTWASIRSLKTRPDLAFAGALAISTYFANISYDYNLITTLPLFWLLSQEVFQNDPELPLYFVLLAGVFGIFTHRGIVTDSNGFFVHKSMMYGQLVFLIGASVWVALTRKGQVDPRMSSLGSGKNILPPLSR